MKAWKIGFVALTMALAGACGSDSSGDGEGGDTGSDVGATGSLPGATTGATTNTTGSQGGATTGGSTTGGTGATTGGGTGSTTGSTTGGTTGMTAMNACTNAADKAILDKLSVQQLACEGAACAGKNINFVPPGIKEPETATCVKNEAPNLKMLSAGCQQCFVNITVCVPKSCVSLLGGKSDACSMGTSLPNTDFSKCTNPPKSSAECDKCQMDNCQAAFVACSGISM